MTPLAHGSGGDELLIAVGAIVLFVVPRMIVERLRRRRERPPDAAA